MATTLSYYSIYKVSNVAITIIFDYYKVATLLHQTVCSKVASVASCYFKNFILLTGFKKKPTKKKSRHYLPPLPHYDRPWV